LRSLIVAEWQLGRHDEARRSAAELMRLQPGMTVSRWLAASPAANYPLGKLAAEILRQAGVPD
jgi:hypothetical protein